MSDMVICAKNWEKESYDEITQKQVLCAECHKTLVVECLRLEKWKAIAKRQNKELIHFICRECMSKWPKNSHEWDKKEKKETMNIKYNTKTQDILDGYDDDDDNEPVYRRDEQNNILKETVHLFNTSPGLSIHITELGADPLGRYEESYRLHVQSGHGLIKLWNDYNFIGTLAQAKEICEKKLKEFVEEQLQQLQNFLKGNGNG